MAVVEAYRVEIMLRLVSVLGVRMCPHCPRCNEKKGSFGCQDRFGSNMRPMGGVLGGMDAFGGSTEHQGLGTPHFHCEGHIVCAYQYNTLTEIAEKFAAEKITLEQWKNYNTWLHYEDVFDSEQHEGFADKVEEAFYERWAGREHDGMCATPEYLKQDSEMGTIEEAVTVSNASSAAKQRVLHEEGNRFLTTYKKDLQFIFNRVQHHCHKKTAKGYVPLKACRLKKKSIGLPKPDEVCKALYMY